MDWGQKVDLDVELGNRGIGNWGEWEWKWLWEGVGKTEKEKEMGTGTGTEGMAVQTGDVGGGSREVRE